MTCTPVSQPVAILIKDAFYYAGKSITQVVPGEQQDFAIRTLNRIIDTWSARDSFIFYNNSVVFTAPGGYGDFRIGNNPGDFIQANPFNNIYSVFFRVADQIDLPTEYRTPKEFDGITIKNIGVWPEYYTFQNQPGYTFFRLFPWPQAGIEVKINGKQQLNDVSLFTSSLSDLPPYCELALIYSLAAELVNSGTGGQPQPDFWKMHDIHIKNFIAANKQDVETELEPTFKFGLGSGMGVTLGLYK